MKNYIQGKSSSPCTIEGHNNLSKRSRAIYLFINTLNNLLPNIFVEKSMSINNFKFESTERIDSIVKGRSTPSRFLCNIFWSLFPWEKTKDKLGKINMLDLGCGEGYLTKRLLSRYGKENISKYLGIDVSNDYKMWVEIANEHKNISFKSIGDVINVGDYIESDTNFLISQSVLEHIDTDLELFKSLKKYIYLKRKPFIQVHLFPSAACLWLYLYHGYRQYTPRSISKFAKLFDDKNTDIKLFRLGGSQSFQIQMKYFSSHIYQIDKMPKDYTENSISQILYFSDYLLSHYLIGKSRKSQYWDNENRNLNSHKLQNGEQFIENYNSLLVSAIKKDTYSSDNCPLFYALIISSFLDDVII